MDCSRLSQGIEPAKAASPPNEASDWPSRLRNGRPKPGASISELVFARPRPR